MPGRSTFGSRPPTRSIPGPRRTWRLEKLEAFERYLEGLANGQVAWNEELSGRIGEEALLPRVKGTFDDAKVAPINKTTTMTEEGRQRILSASSNLVHWSGEKN